MTPWQWRVKSDDGRSWTVDVRKEAVTLRDFLRDIYPDLMIKLYRVGKKREIVRHWLAKLNARQWLAGSAKPWRRGL